MRTGPASVLSEPRASEAVKKSNTCPLGHARQVKGPDAQRSERGPTSLRRKALKARHSKAQGASRAGGTEPWVESAEKKSLKGRHSIIRGAFCAALSGLNSIIPPDTQGSRARCR